MYLRTGLVRLNPLPGRLLPSLSAFVVGTGAWVAMDAWLARASSAIVSAASRIPRFLPSLSAFVGGTGALIVTDAWIARSANAESVDEWVALKTLIMMGGTLAVAGLDQVVVREPASTQKVRRWGVINAVVIAAIIGAAAAILGYYANTAESIAVIAASAVSLLYFGIFRAHLQYTKAQVARDGWKLLLLLLLGPLHFVFGVRIGLVVVVAAAIGVLLAVVFRVESPRATALRQSHAEVSDYRSAMVVGLPFSMAAFALAIASYGELALVRWFGSPEDVRPYLRGIVLFSYPSLAFTTYISTHLGPAIRETPREWSELVTRRRTFLLSAFAALPFAALVFGYILEPLMFPTSSTPLWLAALLSVVASLRLAYTIVSSFVSSLAAARELLRVATAYLVAAVLTVPMCGLLILLGASILQAVAVTALLHWCARSAIGWSMTIRLIRRSVVEVY